LTRWGIFAAFAALLCGAAPAAADEASAATAVTGHTQFSAVGISSYYGAEFNGRRTADGEIFDMHGLTAAHKTLPIPCYARVTNLDNGRSIVVRVNDRGPYIAGRMLDVSERVAKLLFFNGGMSRVRLDYLGKAGPAGVGDQRALMASLRPSAEPALAAIAKAARPADSGVTVAERTAPALAYANAPQRAPAAAALEAAIRPAPTAQPEQEPLAIASQLDGSVRRLEAALEAASNAGQHAVKSLSPYGDLVVAPFKRLIEASR
jgi:rare lipoprotein A (peptidoglycan hydrolase)